MTAGKIQAETDLQPLLPEVDKRDDDSLRRIQNWIKQPTIAAEDRAWSPRPR